MKNIVVDIWRVMAIYINVVVRWRTKQCFKDMSRYCVIMSDRKLYKSVLQVFWWHFINFPVIIFYSTNFLLKINWTNISILKWRRYSNMWVNMITYKILLYISIKFFGLIHRSFRHDFSWFHTFLIIPKDLLYV